MPKSKWLNLDWIQKPHKLNSLILTVKTVACDVDHYEALFTDDLKPLDNDGPRPGSGANGSGPC